MTQYYPARIIEVAPDSAARRCGLRTGDKLLALNGMPLRDVIDVQVYGGEAELSMLFERDDRRRECRVRRRYGEPLGMAFAEDLFDAEARVCRNNCEFCFVAQMAPGLRRGLYVKDDDYRLSFLHGNYITLTNLDDADWDRIETQYLSPLYVSVHATEPDVRVSLMKNPRAGKILSQLQQLAEMGVDLHTQVVLVPGRNDGVYMDQTITDLAALYPAVQTLSVVPVGLTRWHNPGLRPYSDEEAAGVLEQVARWQSRLRADLGVAFVYPSDEWYLRARVTVPEVGAYDSLLPAMIENGVGMVRRFLDGREALTAALSKLGNHQTWVTGTLFAPVLQSHAVAAARRMGGRVEVVAVPNRFFGETVTVAGLLTVQDVLDELSGRDLGDALVLPEEMFRGLDGQSLDGRTRESMQESLGVPVYTITAEEHSEKVFWSVSPQGDQD